MKTLMVILGLVIGTSMVANAQTQAKPASNTATHATAQPVTTHPATQPAAQQTTQSQAQSKSMIKMTELSKPIQDNLATQFKGWTPTQAYRLDTKGTISYEVMVKKEANEMRLFYDNAGKYLREEQVAAMTPQSNKPSAAPKHQAQATPATKPASKPK
jgi:hypothetical protein